MKGKRLYHLIQSLGRGEYKSLIYMLNQTDDKRANILLDILDFKFKEPHNLDAYIHAVFKTDIDKKNVDENDKKARRFITYACETIEDYKLLQIVRNDKVKRYQLLSDEVKNEKDLYLFDFFSKKLEKEAEKAPDFNALIFLYNWKISSLGRQQVEKNLKIVKQILEEKIMLINYSQHEQLSLLHRISSNLFLDDIRFSNENLNTFSETDFKSLIADSQNPFFTADYYISRARYSFFSSNCLPQINEAKQFINSINLHEKQKSVLLRRCVFLELSALFHRNETIENLLIVSKKLHNFNLQLKFRDSLGFFNYCLILFLNKQLEKLNITISEYNSFYYSSETLFYHSFIQGLLLINKNGAIKNQKAVSIFSELKYCPNYYIAAWASLIEITLHFNSNNILLCKSLIKRNKSLLAKGKQRFFTYEASLSLHLVLQNKIKNVNANTAPKMLSPIHNYIHGLLQ